MNALATVKYDTVGLFKNKSNRAVAVAASTMGYKRDSLILHFLHLLLRTK